MPPTRAPQADLARRAAITRRVSLAGSALLLLFGFRALVEASPGFLWWQHLALIAAVAVMWHIAAHLPNVLWRNGSYNAANGLPVKPALRVIASELSAGVALAMLGAALLVLFWSLVRWSPLWWLYVVPLLFVLDVALFGAFPLIASRRGTALRGSGAPEGAVAAVERAAGSAMVRVVDQEGPAAAATGLGRARTIVIASDVLERPVDEVVAAVLHERAHLDRRHALVLSGLLMLVDAPLALTAALASSSAPVMGWFGATAREDVVLAPVVVAILFGLSALHGAVGSAINRALERDADLAALDAGARPEALESLLLYVAARPRRYLMTSRDHPPVAERIAMCRAFSAQAGGEAPHGGG